MSNRRSTGADDPLPSTTTVHVRSIKSDDDEEQKEQPTIAGTLRPPHSRPPSIQIQHQRNGSSANAMLASPVQSSDSLPSSARSSLRGLFGRHGKKASVLPFTPSPLQPFDASANGSPITPQSAPPADQTITLAQPSQPAADTQQHATAEEQKEQHSAGQREAKHRSNASVAWRDQVQAGTGLELTGQAGGAAVVDAVSPFTTQQTVEEESEDELREEEAENGEEDETRRRQSARMEAGNDRRDMLKQAPATMLVEAEDERESVERDTVREEKYEERSDTEIEQKPTVTISQQPPFEHKYDDDDDDDDDDSDDSLPAPHTTAAAITTDDSTADELSSYGLPPPASLSDLSACLPPALLALLDQLRSASPFDPSEHELSASDRHVVQLERLSVADVKEAERRREQQRLEERGAVLQEWKEREWRVWKEERRVQRLLQYEHDKQKADMRDTEVRLWDRQDNQAVAELATLDKHEQAIFQQLHADADITVTSLSSTASSPTSASLVDPTALSFAAFPSVHRRYRAQYRHAPRLLSLHVHALRSVKDKLPAGQYHIRVSLYDRLGGRPLAWTGSTKHGNGDSSKQRRECGSASVMTREAVRHGGGWWEQEMLFGQPANRMLLACPATVDSLPSMVLLFEVLMASEAVGATSVSSAPVVAWGAFPLSSFGSAQAEPGSTAASSSSASSTAAPSAASASEPAIGAPTSRTSTLALRERPPAAPSSAPPAPTDVSTQSLPPALSARSVTSALVSGHHRLPLLAGPYNPSVRTWRELHRRISSDLNVWLCNLYFHASDGAERVEQERDYCVELQLGKRQQPTAEQTTSNNEQYVLLPPEEDGEIGERKRKRNRPLHAQSNNTTATAASAAAALMSRRLAHMDVTHSELVRHVRARDGVSADDMSDPFAVWPDKDDEGWRWLDTGDSMDRGEGWQAGQPSHEERELAVTLRARKRKRKLESEDTSMHATSAAYQLAVGAKMLGSSRSASLVSALKLRYVWGHLDTVYHVSHPLSWPFISLALLLVLTLWARLFLHYFTEYVFLSTALSSSSSLSIECSWLGCAIEYHESLSIGTFLLLCVLGSITPLVILLLLCPLPPLYRRLTRRSPPLLADTLLLCFATCLVVDPFLVNNTGLYDDADSVTTLLVVLLSLSFAIVATLVAYLYLVHLHMDGAVLDTWQRHQPAAVVDALYCVPSDYCMPIEELLAVIAASRQWRGELGERRRVRVKESGDGQSTYVSIVAVVVDDEKEAEAEVYRQFVLLRDGHVYELFDTRDVTQQSQLTATAANAAGTAAEGGDTVAPATADAYLARLLKGRGKVMPRSARQLWAIARNHFNLSRSRGSSHSTVNRVDSRRSTFMRNGTVARLSTVNRHVRSGSVAGSVFGGSAVNRMGTFGQQR